MENDEKYIMKSLKGIMDAQYNAFFGTFKNSSMYSNTSMLLQSMYSTIEKINDISSFDNIYEVEDFVRLYTEDIEKALEVYLCEMDMDVLHDIGSYIYEKIQEKAVDYTSDKLESLRKQGYIILESEDNNAIEALIANIDFDSLYSVAEELLEHKESSMESKLADIGMSAKDFL